MDARALFLADHTRIHAATTSTYDLDDGEIVLRGNHEMTSEEGVNLYLRVTVM